MSVPRGLPLKPFKTAPRKSPPKPTIPPATQAEEWLLQSSSHPRLDYVAREEPLGSPGSLLKHYVGVYDPQTGAVQVVRARKVIVSSTLRGAAVEAEETERQTVRWVPKIKFQPDRHRIHLFAMS